MKKLSEYIKLIAFAMAAVFTLCACSGDNASSSEASSVPEYVQDTSAKVGYVYNEEVSHDNMTYMFEKAARILKPLSDLKPATLTVLRYHSLKMQ